MQTLSPSPLPPPDAKIIFPPNRDHAFFELANEVVFESAANGFSWANAWWLAEASLLSYDDPRFVKARFEQAGWEMCDDELLSDGAAQCYVVRNDSAVIVAFRGTEVVHRSSDRGFLEKTADVINDIVANVQVAPHRLGDEAVWVHHGFNEALANLLDWQLRPLLDEVQGDRTLWLTGHSLGGALAAVACHYLEDARGAYTFGAPRVGNEAFVSGLEGRVWRLVNETDLVTRVPPERPDKRLDWLEPGYQHAGQAVHFNQEGTVFEAPADEEPPKLLVQAAVLMSTPSLTWRWLRNRLTQSLSNFKDLPSFLKSLKKIDGMREMVHGLVDHAPIYYALKTRNALAEHLSDPDR